MPKISLPDRAIVKKLRAIQKRLSGEGLTGILHRACEAVLYPRWIRSYESERTAPPSAVDAHFVAHQGQPLVSVIMPVFNSDIPHLRQAIDSVLAQTLPNWELCIADDCSADPAVGGLLKDYEAKDHRIRTVQLTTNSHISAATNAAAALATGDYLAFLDHDDILAPEALQRVEEVLSRSPNIELLYTDEDKITPRGRRHRPHFKPDFNRELLLSYNYICHLMVVRRSTFMHHGGMRVGFEGAQDWDLALRVTESVPPDAILHIPRVLYHWRTTPSSTASAGSVKSYALDAGIMAVSEHLARTGVTNARVGRNTLLSAVEVDYPLEQESTSVSAIVVSRARAEHLPKLPLDSRFDVEQILLPAPSGDILSELNKATAHARGKVITVFLDPIEYQPDLMHHLLSCLLRPDIGCVGGLALDRRHRIVSGGIIRGVGGAGDYILRGVRAPTVSHFGRGALPQDVSAVSLACFAVRAEDLRAIGGFPKTPALGVDAEISLAESILRLRKRIIFNPRASVVMRSSPYGYNSSQPSMIIEEDPFYNPNLSSLRADFTLAWPPRRQHHPGR